MSDSIDELILDLLQWLGPDPRDYHEVLEAWRTSCPRLPVWEEASNRGFVTRGYDAGHAFVRVTPRGLKFLRARRLRMGLPETMRTERLELRPFSLSDGPAVFAYSQDADWTEYQQTTPSSQLEAERVVAELLLRDWENQPVWAITRSGEVVGLVSLVFSAEHRIAQLGYGIHKDHRGLGLTSEAIRAVLDQAFAVHEQLARVTANTDARNQSSRRLLERLGFTQEGTLRSGGVTAKGELVDGVIHGLLRSEWRACGG